MHLTHSNRFLFFFSLFLFIPNKIMIFKVIKKPSLLCSIPCDMTGHIKKRKKREKKGFNAQKTTWFFSMNQMCTISRWTSWYITSMKSKGYYNLKYLVTATNEMFTIFTISTRLYHHILGLFCQMKNIDAVIPMIPILRIFFFCLYLLLFFRILLLQKKYETKAK